MAACSVTEKALAAACWKTTPNGALTRQQQKLALIYLYWSLGIAFGAVMPVSVSAMPSFAACWQDRTPDELRAFELLAALDALNNASPGNGITAAIAVSSMACLNGLSDTSLDKILAAIKCSMFQSFGSP